MITAIIVDDESKGRIALKEKLKTYCPQVQVMAEAGNAEEAMELIDRLKPRLLFLDIEMPRMNGFEMLNAIPEKNFQVIFTTAYDQYAIKAIKYAAFDYLLKPIDIEELKIAVQKATENDPAATGKQAEWLRHNITDPGRQLNKLVIPTLDGLLFYDIKDIVHLEASSNYTSIHFSNGNKVIASRTLKDFEEMLPREIFFRPHHSHIINMNYIKRYIKGDGGQIELQNGSYVDVSRRKKEEFLKIIGY